MSDATMDLEKLMPIIKEKLEMGESVRFTPNGTSMRPMLEGGRDQVILSPLPQEIKKYDLPLYRRDNGHFVLHRVIKADENKYTCIGDNQFVYEVDVQKDQLIGMVTGFARKGKEYTVSNVVYKLYCRFWHYSRPMRLFYRAVIYKLKQILQIKKND